MGKEDDIPEGFEGNLTSEQTEKLKEAWRIYFKVLKGEHGAISGVKADKNAADDEDANKQRGEGEDQFKDKSKDDNAKEEETKQREQKEASALLGSYPPEELRKAYWDGSRGETPDALMLRFLRARKWDVDRAFAMACSVGKWRLDNDVLGITRKGEEGLCEEDGFRLQYDSGKTYIQGTDKQDRPIVYIHVAKHKIMDQSQEALQRFTIFGIESAKQLLTPRCRGQGCIIFNLDGFGLANMDWQCLRFLIEVFEARYPETLGVLLIHKAPIVALGLWRIISPFLDPVVRDKIKFVNNAKDLSEYIDLKHLPKSMGGEMQWEWSYSGPAKNENARMQEKEKRNEVEKQWNEAVNVFEELTRKWIDGDKKAGEEREKYGNALIMTRFYDSDPYLRGQNVYTRNGTAVGDGTVCWHYPDHDETFGRSYDEVRKEYDIPGKCPRNGHPDGPVAAAQHALDNAKDPDEAAAFAAGKTGGGSVSKLKRRASHSMSVLTPGKSGSEQARQDAEAERERLQKDLEKAKKQEEQQRKEEEEAHQKKVEEEESKGQPPQRSGIFGAITNQVSWASGAVYSTAQATAQTAAGLVPAAVGGNVLREYVSGDKEESQTTDTSKPAADNLEEAADDGTASEDEAPEPVDRSHYPLSYRRADRRARRTRPKAAATADSSTASAATISSDKSGYHLPEPDTVEGAVSSKKAFPPDERVHDAEPYEATRGPGKDYDDGKEELPARLF